MGGLAQKKLLFKVNNKDNYIALTLLKRVNLLLDYVGSSSLLLSILL